MADQSNEMGMVERVAAAAYDAERGNRIVRLTWEGQGGLRKYATTRANYLSMARAAIEALREPTDAVLSALSDQIDDGTARDEMAVAGWHAALDAALSHDEVKG